MNVKNLLLAVVFSCSAIGYCQAGDATNPGNWNLSYSFEGSSKGTDYIDDRSLGGPLIVPHYDQWTANSLPRARSYSSWSPEHPSLEAQMEGELKIQLTWTGAATGGDSPDEGLVRLSGSFAGGANPHWLGNWSASMGGVPLVPVYGIPYTLTELLFDSVVIVPLDFGAGEVILPVNGQAACESLKDPEFHGTHCVVDLVSFNAQVWNQAAAIRPANYISYHEGDDYEQIENPFIIPSVNRIDTAIDPEFYGITPESYTTRQYICQRFGNVPNFSSSRLSSGGWDSFSSGWTAQIWSDHGEAIEKKTLDEVVAAGVSGSPFSHSIHANVYDLLFGLGPVVLTAEAEVYVHANHEKPKFRRKDIPILGSWYPASNVVYQSPSMGPSSFTMIEAITVTAIKGWTFTATGGVTKISLPVAELGLGISAAYRNELQTAELQQVNVGLTTTAVSAPTYFQVWAKPLTFKATVWDSLYDEAGFAGLYSKDLYYPRQGQYGDTSYDLNPTLIYTVTSGPTPHNPPAQ